MAPKTWPVIKAGLRTTNVKRSVTSPVELNKICLATVDAKRFYEKRNTTHARDLGEGKSLQDYKDPDTLCKRGNMAASGINEHHEACRKQNFINRQTFHKHLLEAKLARNESPLREHLARKESSKPGHLGPLSSYDLEKLHKKHGAAGTDQERRNAVKQHQYLTYSAKINGRLSSTDYSQQW
ncbi:uncharacterized protein LOC101849240 [Aplysia californica]|uniref:Uncharacterized protein LOC101849240 n=1 Tax=Aplysia californica TaxID=6500 RepID=A0ABM1A9C2_APLCA|nr:uncharacterized protein LOC101849240 [Aplysia californica]